MALIVALNNRTPKAHAPIVGGIIASLLVVLALGHAAAAADFSVGFTELALTDPVEGGPMAGLVLYPSAAAAGRTHADQIALDVDGVRNAPLAAGRFALIVLSHGTGGSRFGHIDSLTALARAGFVAASIDHPRNNTRDNSGFGTDLQWYGRPHHIVALIDALLADPRFAPAIDPARIGMAGFSAGGYTTLVIVGARPNFALAADYCRSESDDPMWCGPRPPDRPFRQRPDLEPVSDPRVRAAVVMAPGPGFVFDRAGLADVRVPVRLYRAGVDEVLRRSGHAERVRDMLPTPPEYVVIEGAGHYVFLLPCSEALTARAPQFCRDPPGVDRAAIHRQLNAEMVDFFRRTLGTE